MKYVLILIVFGAHHDAVGTFQLQFDSRAACESAGQAAQVAAGVYHWERPDQGVSGLDYVIDWRCLPISLE